jgi:hypothetical protein
MISILKMYITKNERLAPNYVPNTLNRPKDKSGLGLKSIDYMHCNYDKVCHSIF